MPKYIPNPARTVTAHVIRDTRQVGGLADVEIEGLGWLALPEGATARYQPVAGDYLVMSDDGYMYVNPKGVFESHWVLPEQAPAPVAGVPDPKASTTSTSESEKPSIPTAQSESAGSGAGAGTAEPAPKESAASASPGSPAPSPGF